MAQYSKYYIFNNYFFGGYNLCVLLHKHVYFFFVGAYIQPTHPYPDSPAADIYIDLMLAKGRIGERDVMALRLTTTLLAVHEKRKDEDCFSGVVLVLCSGILVCRPLMRT